MRLSRMDFVPVLTIMAGGVIGASLSFSFLGSRSDDVPGVTRGLLYESSATVEPATRVGARVGTVTGRVTDAQTRGSVAAAQLYISSLNLGGLSQRNGRYLLQNVPVGTYTLAVARIGYRTVEVQITIGGGQTVERNFSIAEEALQLGTVIVPGTPSGTRRRAMPKDAVTVDRAAITGRVPITSMQQMLAGRTPGLNPDPTHPRIVAGPLEPTFTPMMVRPEIRNLAEVQEALMREYLPLLRDTGVEGTVVVWFFISDEGQVLDRRVSQSSGRTPLDEAALTVADVFRFTPALNRDERVPVWIQLHITFQVH